MTQEKVAYFNGEIVPESQARVSIRDAGFLLGDAVFDTTRTFGGRIFKLEEHLDRLFNSLTYMRIDPGMSKEHMAGLTMEVPTHRRSPWEERWASAVRTTVS